MKRFFLAVYDYGQGGIWWFVWARSKEEITDLLPKLTVVDKPPDWMLGDMVSVRVVDIDNAADLDRYQ